MEDCSPLVLNMDHYKLASTHTHNCTHSDLIGSENLQYGLDEKEPCSPSRHISA